MIQLRIDITEPNAQYRAHLRPFIEELRNDCFDQGFSIEYGRLEKIVVGLKILLDHLDYVGMDYQITGPAFGLPCHFHSLFISQLANFSFPQQREFNELIKLCMPSLNNPSEAIFTLHHNTLNIMNPL